MSFNYSIIIPHYNIPHLLGRLLFTIPRRDDTQVIVCDDCSTPENYQAVLALKEKYPQIEIYQTDQCGGGGKARNLGLRHAKGKYLIFADADDYFNLCFPRVLDKYVNSDYDIIYFGANSVDCDSYHNVGRGISVREAITYAIEHNDVESLRYSISGPMSKFILREIIDENDILFQESLIANDVRFSWKADSFAKRLHADILAIYCLTKRENSTEFNIDKERLLTRVGIDLEKIKFVRDVAQRQPNMEPIRRDYKLMKRLYPTSIKELEKLLRDSGFSPSKLKRRIFAQKLHQSFVLFKGSIGIWFK